MRTGERLPVPHTLPIVQYWHPRPWPAEIAASFVTFTAQNPGLRHLIFDQPQAEAFIAAHFSARELAAFRECAVPAMRADYFRYCAILVLGGVYVDADARCIASLKPLLDGVADEGGHIFQRPEGILPTGAFAFAPGHPFLRLVLDAVTVNVERRIVDGPVGLWLSTGPGVFTLIHRLHGAGSIGAFLDLARGTEAEGVAGALCEVAGDYGRVVQALRRVRISPLEASRRWIRAPGVPLPYKQTESHWTNVRGSIFRQPEAGRTPTSARAGRRSR
jgi:Glycosyltransferase sugar-binding region containing DXD motif